MITLTFFISLLLLLALAILILPLRKSLQGSVLIAGLLVSVLSLSLYAYLGSAPQVAEMMRVQQLRQQLGTPQQVIAALLQHLKQDPHSARGWYLLGRMYLHTQQFNLAAEAFKKAKALGG